MLFPVAALAGPAAVVSDLALRAPAQRRTAALLLTEEASEQVYPLDRLFLGAWLLALAELLAARVLLSRGGGRGDETGGGRRWLSVLGAHVSECGAILG